MRCQPSLVSNDWPYCSDCSCRHPQRHDSFVITSLVRRAGRSFPASQPRHNPGATHEKHGLQSNRGTARCMGVRNPIPAIPPNWIQTGTQPPSTVSEDGCEVRLEVPGELHQWSDPASNSPSIPSLLFPLGVLQGQDSPLLLPGLHRPGDAARSQGGSHAKHDESPASRSPPRAPLRLLLLAWARNLEEPPRGGPCTARSPFARAASWYGRKASADSVARDTPKDQEVDALSRRKAWARLLAKVHELDVMACPRCGSRMSVIAVIVDPAQIRKIIACLDRHGRGPPRR